MSAYTTPLLHPVNRNHLAKMTFSRRQSSWIAVEGDSFFKIPKRSGAPDDWILGADFDAASKEFAAVSWLADIESAVLRPTGLDGQHACIVFPRLLGEDLIDDLLRARDHAQAQPAIKEAVEILGRLHAKVRQQDGIPSYDYCSDPHYPLKEPGLLHEGPTTVVIRGVEVRNFRRQSACGPLRFFDPHDVWWGFPEEDLTRFVISLLMIRWARKVSPLPWMRFDFEFLCTTYERTASIQLSKRRMRYCAELNLRMRKHNAIAASAILPRFLRTPAKAYLKMYFSRMERWLSQHGF